MPTIFISYRRADSLADSIRIKEALAQRFGSAILFLDQDTIPSGVDFRKSIEDGLKDCVAMVVVIGNQWLTACDESGSRRLDDASDYVRLEVSSALQRAIPVIPVVLPGAIVPAKEDLPDDISDLSFRNAVFLSEDSDAEIQKLLDDIMVHLWHSGDEDSRQLRRNESLTASLPTATWASGGPADWRTGALNKGAALSWGHYVWTGFWWFGYFYIHLLTDQPFPLIPNGVFMLVFDAFYIFTGIYAGLFLLEARFGKCEVHVTNGNAKTFEGVLIFGRYRRFRWSRVRGIEAKPGCVSIVVANQDFHDIERRIDFARLLSVDRRAALFRILSSKVNHLTTTDAIQ